MKKERSLTHLSTAAYRRFISSFLLLCPVILCFTKSALAESDYALETNQWHQLVAPGDSGRSDLSSLFSGLLPLDQYNASWVVYLWDNQQAAYVNPGLEGSIPTGQGFWIIQLTGDTVTLDTANLPAAPTAPSSACPTENGCIEVPLFSEESQSSYAMIGSTQRVDQTVDSITVLSSGIDSACSNGCSHVAAAQLGLVNTVILRFNPLTENYEDINSSGVLKPWQSAWFQKGDAAPDQLVSYLFTGQSPFTKPTFGSNGQGSPSTGDCDYYINGNIAQAVADAPESSVGCVHAGDYISEGVVSLSVDDRTIRADGQVELRGIRLEGARITVDGFRFTAGGEQIEAAIEVRGDGHQVINNYIDGTKATFGIGCSSRVNCSNSTIRNNTITGIESIGIFITHRNNVVEWNNVYDLFRTKNDYDVDAMRFFGKGHRIRNNYFHDINEFKSVRSASGDTPHVDCWQTYTTFADDQAIETTDVIIENNYCVRISRQCLILENNRTDQRVTHGIVFRNNVCETFDSQIVNLKGVENISIHNNFLGGRPKYQVVKFQLGGASGTRETSKISVRNNILQDDSDRVHPTYGSNPGGIVSDNIILQRDPVAVGSDDFQTDPLRNYVAIQSSDFLSFLELNKSLATRDLGASLAEPGERDLSGQPRVQGSTIDIGPYER